MSAHIFRTARFLSSLAKTSGAEPKITTLANGLRVISQHTTSGPTKVGVFVNDGSRDETATTNGAAQLAEKLAFKGTSKRKQNDLEAEVEGLGGVLTSCVSTDQSCFVFKSTPLHLAKGVEILADVFSNTTFDTNTVAEQKQAILQQLAGSPAPCETVFHYLRATAFQGSPLANPVAGTCSSIKGMTTDALKQHVAATHVASRAVVVATGDIDHDALVNAAKIHFGSLPSGSPKSAAARVPFTGSEVRVRDDFQPLAHLAVAVEGAPAGHEDYAALLVASAVVGSYDEKNYGRRTIGGDLARATQTHKLATRYHSFYQPYGNTALWGIYGVTGRENIEDFVYEFQQAWMHLVASASTSDVDRARNAVLHALLDPSACALQRLGSAALLAQTVEPLAALVDRVAGVSVADVRKVASEYVYDKCPAVACYGPIEQFPDYNRLRSSMYWLRM